PERDAVAVRELEVLVDPRAVRQALALELARREHELRELAVERVAIVVDRDELVIRADLLELRERIEQRAVIPQADVVDGGAVVFDDLGGELAHARELALDDVGETIGSARRLDVARDIRRLFD